MPGKSRHARRRLSRSKKRKGGQVSSAVAAQQPAVTQADKPAASPKVSAPSASVPSPLATLTAVRYPYIVTELRRIGILAGIMLVILIVLALVLS